MVAILTGQTAAPLKAAGITLAAIVLAACGGGNTDSALGGNEPTNVQVPKGWQLVWSDEFDGSALNRGRWNIQTGDGTAEGIPGWGNNELQSYQAGNISVGGGNLTITAKQEAADGRQYTSARINLAKDEWATVAVQISEIAHNPGNFGGDPVDLAQVSLFVLEPTSFAHVRVDNIRIICGHIREGDCGISPPAPPPPSAADPQPVYIDAVDPISDVGINGADSGSGWVNYADGTNRAGFSGSTRTSTPSSPRRATAACSSKGRSSSSRTPTPTRCRSTATSPTISPTSRA